VQASHGEQTGGAGISQVSANFQLIDWGPVPNSQHDLGVDLFVQARDERMFDRGLFVGAQVKTGPSYFSDPGADGDSEGWWYYEDSARHFDDWVTHGLPHLLVLHDLTTATSYWVHVTAAAVRSTGLGCKILVPKSQTIDLAHRDQLLRVAATQKATIGFEGSLWSAGVAAAPPARRLRCALLAPRLIAPHRNLGYEKAIAPEEAVALLVRGRVLDFERFADNHASVPVPAEAGNSSDWRWRFVHALWEWLVNESFDAVLVAVKTASRSEHRAAAMVVAACGLLDQEHHEEAIAMISEIIDGIGSVDRAWLLVQRGRLRAEIGQLETARSDVVEAQRLLVADPDDVTVSVIAAAAATLLFDTAGWGNRDLGEVMPAIDTAVSWWRAETLSYALQEASERAFRSWSDDKAERWVAQDELNNGLLSATLNAHFAGEHGAWRAASGLHARHALMSGHEQGQVAEVAAALNQLRRSGDSDSLALAATRVWRTGPLAALADATQRILTEPSSWVHTTARSNLELWEEGGDVLPEADADRAVRFCLDLYTNDEHWLAARTRPTFMAHLAILDSLDGLLPAASDSAHQSIAGVLAEQQPDVHELTAQHLAAAAAQLRVRALTAEQVVALRDAATRQQHRQLSAVLLGKLAERDPEARRTLAQRVLDGDDHALSEFGDIRLLDVSTAKRFIDRYNERLERIVADAEKGTVVGYLFDACHSVALLNAWFPDISEWDPLLALLAHPKVAPGNKRSACQLLCSLSSRLPNQVTDELRTIAPVLTNARQLPGFFDAPIEGVAFELSVAVGAIDGAALAERAVQLLTGSWQERRDLARALGRTLSDRLEDALVVLSADDHSDVQAAAATSLARRLRDDPSPLMPLEMVRRLAANDGTTAPLSVLSGLYRDEDPLTDLALVEIVRPLGEHVSARVRTASQRVLTG